MIIRRFTVCCIVLLLPSFVSAQDAQQNSRRDWNTSPRFEIISSIAVGHVFRYEDKGFGNHFNFGVGAEMPVWRSDADPLRNQSTGRDKENPRLPWIAVAPPAWHSQVLRHASNLPRGIG